MRRTHLHIALVAALATLAGCSAGGGGSALGTVAGMIPGLSRILPGGGSATPPAGFTAEDLAANPGEFMLMGVPALSADAGLARIIQDNGAEETYQSQAGYTAAFDRGLLVATRGLPDDLIAAHVDEVFAALRRGGGSAVRVHDSLDSLNQIVQARYQCQIVSNGSEAVNLGVREATGRKFTETCLSNAVQFENVYWLDGNGAIMASRQFISVTVAYLRSNRL